MNRILLLLLVIGVIGCGDGKPALVPVLGKLTLDGVPVPHKHVKFLPENVTPGIGGGGVTDKNGTFKLLAIRPGSIKDEAGVPPGSYRVIVVEPLFQAEAQPEPANPENGPAPAVGIPMPKPAKSGFAIPGIYGNTETTPLKVEVPAKGGEINLELKSKSP